MVKHYTLSDEKPDFKYGALVTVDMAVLSSEGLLQGKIVGRGSVNVIDFWIVEFEKDFAPLYPYRVLSVPHTAFVKT
jgi:hypothetical protein